MDKKSYIFPFPKKSDLRIAKNYHELTFIAAKIYNALLLNCIEPEFFKKS